MKHLLIGAILFFLAQIGLAQAGEVSENCPEGLRPYVIDWWPGPFMEAAWVAVDLKFTEEVGCLDVQLNSFSGRAAKNLAFVSGQIDALFGAEVTFSSFEKKLRATSGSTTTYYGAVATGSVYAIVGVSDNPADLLGSTILVAHCTIGDFTTGYRDNPSQLTDSIRAYARATFPGVRLYCLAPNEDKEDDSAWATKGSNTIYLRPLPGSKNRKIAMISGAEQYAGVTIGQALTLTEENGLKVTVGWAALPGFPSLMLAGKSDAGKEELHRAFIDSMNAAMMYVIANRDEEIDRMTANSINGEVTPFNGLVAALSNPVDAVKREKITRRRIAKMFEIGIDGGLWSISGCIPKGLTLNYMTYLMQNEVEVTDIFAEGVFCPD